MTSPLTRKLVLSLLLSTALTPPAYAACVSSADLLTLNCSGGLSLGAGLPITIYDAAAGYQPSNGSNSYTPSSINANPPTVTVNFDASTIARIINPSSNALADKGLIVANFSNSEDPAVNNVVINNFGSLSLSTNQIATSRMSVIVADSQVNNFTVNNAGTLAVGQTFFSNFDASKLSNTSSGSPATLTAKYNGATLNVMSTLYSDDNTNSFVINNATGGRILASGNFAAAYYGRADTTIDNAGTIANTSWTSSDSIANGHWAIAAYAGTDYVTAENTNPDSTIVLPNADGSVTVAETSALTLTNRAGATIKGDILALDVTPTVYAAAIGASSNPFPNPTQTLVLNLPVSASSAGPRDSEIANYGTIAGNLALGSGTHVVDNAAGANWTGNISVDQRPVNVVFTVPVAGSTNGVYLSIGGVDFNGNACPAAGADTANAGCAATTKTVASVVGGQSFTFTNEGALAGDIRIFDEASSVNAITLSGTGFSGNIVAVNGTGSNSLTIGNDMTLASVVNFSALDLQSSRLTMSANATTTTPGVTLVDGATLATTISGPGGTLAAPSTRLGSIAGALSFSGSATILPTFAAIIRNGDTYQLASQFSGDLSQVSVAQTGALVTLSASQNAGALLLNAQVLNANQIAGLSKPGAATLNGLLSYGGASAKVQALGVAVESLPTLAAVRAAAESLSPSTNGASIQLPLAINQQFTQQIFSRGEASVYGGLYAPDGKTLAGQNAASATDGASVSDGAWANIIGSNVTQQDVDHVAGYNANYGGFIGGYDRQVAPGLRVGGAVGYATGSAKTQNLFADQLDVQSVEGLIYGGLVQPTYYVNAVAGVAGLSYNSTRTVAFSGFFDNPTANSRNGQLYTVGADAGRPFFTSFGLFTPVASLLFTQINQASYNEKSNAGAGLNVAAQDTSSLQSGLGLKAVLPLGLTAGLASTVDVSAIWRHEFLDTAESVTAAFLGGGDFTATGPQAARDLADLGVALRFGLDARQQNFAISYNARLGANFSEQVGMLRARYDF